MPVSSHNSANMHNFPIFLDTPTGGLLLFSVFLCCFIPFVILTQVMAFLVFLFFVVVETKQIIPLGRWLSFNLVGHEPCH